MGQTRTAEQLKEAGFEAVLNAVGGHSAAPRIPGIDGVNVVDAVSYSQLSINWWLRAPRAS